MAFERITSLAFRSMSAFALLAMLAGAGLGAWNVYFLFSGEVRPGVFAYYRVDRVATRTRDSSGRTYNRYSEESRPVFVYEDAAGKRVEVEGNEAHLFAYLDPGDPIEVTVDPDGDRSPMIRGFLPVFADSIALLLAGGIFLAFAEFARAVALRLVGVAPAAGFGAGEKDERRHRRVGAVSMPPRAAMVERPGRGATLVKALALLSVVLFAGVAVWLLSEKPPTRTAATVGETPPGEPDVATGPLRERALRSAPAAFAKPSARREPSALETAARRGEVSTVQRLLASGADVTEVPLAVVKTLVAREDVVILRLLLEHGFDLSQRYARQTFGDQAVRQRSAEVVRLVREFGGSFDAPPEFVALAAEDLPALRSALAAAPVERRWRGQSISTYGNHPSVKALLEQARAE